MTNLPETSWLPLYEPNPDRKWWQLWKPRQRLTRWGREAFNNELISAEEVPYKLVNERPGDAIEFGHLCVYIGGTEAHIDLSAEVLPSTFSEAAEVAKQALAIALTEITKQVEGD